MQNKLRLILCGTLLATTTLTGCGDSKPTDTNQLTGSISVDGSSTVYPISEAVAEEFQIANPSTRVTVGVSGTGGGFKKFYANEIDINDASRPIKEKEIEQAHKNNIDFIELPVAYDGVTVVVNPKNTFCNNLTVEELKRIWQPGSTVFQWSDIRPTWPNKPINLYGPGVDSGTFDYFTGTINGKEHASRADFTASEDDNVLVRGISGDPNALGFFGFAYYLENKDILKVVGIDNGTGPVIPSASTIASATYAPLSRPIFIYVNKSSLAKPAVKAFLDFYLANVPTLAKDVGYIPFMSDVYTLVAARLAKEQTGTIFSLKENRSLPVRTVLERVK